MPQVPIYNRRFDERSVNLNAPRQSIQTTDAAFGGDAGKGLIALGQGIDRGGNALLGAWARMQEQEDEAQALDAYVRYSESTNAYLYGDGSEGSGVYNRLGGNAVGSTKQSKEDLQEQMQSIAGELGNNRQRDLFLRRAQNLRLESLTGVSRFEAGQRREFHAERYKAAADSEAQTALLNAHSPDLVNEALGRAEQANRAFARMKGMSAEAASKYVGDMSSGALTAIALRYIQQGQYDMAQKVIADPRVKGADALRINERLEPAEQADAVKSMVLSVLPGGLNFASGSSTRPDPNSLGNIRAGASAYRTYATPEDGATDAARLLRKGYRNLTLEQMGAKWAPAGDGNNPSKWASTVAKVSGLDKGEAPDLDNPEVVAKLLKGIAVAEKSSKDRSLFTPEVIQGGVQKAFTGKDDPGQKTPAQMAQQNFSSAIDKINQSIDAQYADNPVKARQLKEAAFSELSSQTQRLAQMQQHQDMADRNTLYSLVADPANGITSVADLQKNQQAASVLDRLQQSDPDTMNKVRGLVSQTNSGIYPVASPKTDALYNELVGQSLNNPQGFMNMDLNNYALELPREQMQGLTQAQLRLKSDKHTIQSENIKKVMGSISNAELKSAGYDPGSDSKSDVQKTNVLTGQVNNQVQDFVKANGRAPSYMESREIMRGLLMQGTVQRAWWFDKKLTSGESQAQGVDQKWKPSVNALTSETRAVYDNEWNVFAARAGLGEPLSDKALSALLGYEARPDTIPADDRKAILGALRKDRGPNYNPSSRMMALIYTIAQVRGGKLTTR